MLTLGEFASAVFSSPCTIHGWRPISVSTQPAVVAMNGKKAATTPTHRNQRHRSNRRFQ